MRRSEARCAAILGRDSGRRGALSARRTRARRAGDPTGSPVPVRNLRSPPGRFEAFLDYLFVGRFVGNPERERLFSALFASIDDVSLQSLLREAYQDFEDACCAALRAERPAAPAAAVRRAAYAIACLAEQNAGFLALGFPRSRARAAREAAALIARSLEEEEHG